MLTKHLKILHVYKENDYHMYKKDTICVEKVDHVFKNVNQAFEKLLTNYMKNINQAFEKC